MLLVIEEKLAKSKRSRIYDCILDYDKMDLFLCYTCMEHGLLFYKNDILYWTPWQMKIQWDLIKEALKDVNPSLEKVFVTPLELFPKKKTTK